MQLIVLEIEGQQQVPARVLFRDYLQGLELDVADLQIDEADAPGLRDVCQDEPDRQAAALDDRPLEGDPDAGGHLPRPLELHLVDDLQLIDDEGPKLFFRDS